jgi:hypothetical protein
MKMGEITRRRVSLPRGPSPNLAAQEFAADNNVFRAVSRLGNEVAKIASEREMIEANVEHRDRVATAQEDIARSQFKTQAELEEMGLLEEVRKAAGRAGLSELPENVPQHLWAPLRMRDVLAESTRDAGKRITLPGVRRRYLAQLDEVNDRQVMRMTELAARQAVQYENQRAEQLFKTALDMGEFQTAREALQSPTFAGNPDMQALLLQQVNRAEEVSTFQDMAMRGETDQAMDMLLDDERETALSNDQRRELYFALQNQEIRQTEAAMKQRKQISEENAKGMYAAIAAGNAGLSEVLATQGNYVKSDFTQLVTFARTMASETVAIDGPTAQAIENQFVAAIEMAERGVFVLGDNREEFQELIRTELLGAATQFDNQGNLVPGLSPSRLSSMLDRVSGMEELPYKSVDYKNLVREMRLRILQSSEDGPSFLAKPDTAQLMANAMDSLHKYMQEEEAAGRQPDLAVWERQNMPQFMLRGAQLEFAKVPDDVRVLVVMKSGDQFGIDYNATIDRMAAKYETYVANNDTAAAQNLLNIQRQFGEYWQAYGQFLGEQ